MSEDKALGIFIAICRIMSDLEPIAKTRQNTEQRYRFRGIDDFYNALQPLLAKHSVFTVPQVKAMQSAEVQSKKGSSGYRVTMEVDFVFMHADGSYIKASAWGEAIDYGDKACAKAMTMAHKYCLQQVFCVPTEEGQDTETASHDLAPKEAAPQALHKAKQALLAMVTQRRASVKSAIGHQDWIGLVVKAELDQEKIESLADLEQVKEAITSGRYDLDKASQVPF